MNIFEGEPILMDLCLSKYVFNFQQNISDKARYELLPLSKLPLAHEEFHCFACRRTFGLNVCGRCRQAYFCR